MGYRTVMIVEDNRATANLYRSILSAKDYEPYVAESGEAALQAIPSVEPSAFVLDIDLPGITGIETCKRIRALIRRSVPIVFLTASTDPAVLVSCFEAGGDDYILKSANFEQVASRIEYWLGEGRTKDMAAARQEKLERVRRLRL